MDTHYQHNHYIVANLYYIIEKSLTVQRSFAHPPEVGPFNTFCRLTECSGIGIELYGGAISWSVLVCFGLSVALTHIPEAQSELNAERERVTTEQNAFTAFQREVSEIKPMRPAPKQIPVRSTHTGSANTQVEQIRQAYRETIMSMSHYETEYNEPIEANMTAELGGEMATAILDGREFTQQVKSGLISQCGEARKRRKKLIILLEREQRRLDNAETELEAILSEFESEATELDPDHTFSELSNIWARLGKVENRCREFIQTHPAAQGNSPYNRADFPGYVYNSLSTSHPVLSEGIGIFERITEYRRTVLRTLTQTA